MAVARLSSRLVDVGRTGFMAGRRINLRSLTGRLKTLRKSVNPGKRLDNSQLKMVAADMNEGQRAIRELQPKLKQMEDIEMELPSELSSKIDALNAADEALELALKNADATPELVMNASRAYRQAAQDVTDSLSSKTKILDDLTDNAAAAGKGKKLEGENLSKWEKLKKGGKMTVKAGGFAAAVVLTIAAIEGMAESKSGCFNAEGVKVSGFCWCNSDIAEAEGEECALSGSGLGTERSLCGNEYRANWQLLETSGVDHPNTECQSDRYTEEDFAGDIEDAVTGIAMDTLSVLGSFVGTQEEFDPLMLDNWAGQGQWSPELPNASSVKNTELCNDVNCACFDMDTVDEDAVDGLGGVKVAEFCSCSQMPGYSCNKVSPEEIFNGIVSQIPSTAQNALNCATGNIEACGDAACGMPVLSMGCSVLPDFLHEVYAFGAAALFAYLAYILIKSMAGRQSKYK